jgi:hypothetical protein
VCHVEVEDGVNKPFHHRTVRLTWRLVEEGGKFIWYSIFLDEFAKDRYSKICGVYLRWTVLSKDHKKLNENIHLLMYIPQGCNPVQALRLLRRDITLMLPADADERFSVLGEWAGCPSMLPTDYVQRCINCRHLGTKANHNCPHCWTKKEDRLNDVDVRDWATTRWGGQTNRLIQHISTLTVADHIKKFQTSCGLRGVPCAFGLDKHGIDIAMLSPPDLDHLMRYGIIKTSCGYVWESLTLESRQELAGRIKDFPWPRGISVVHFNITKKFGSSIQMQMYRKLLLMLPSCVKGLSYKYGTETNWRLFVNKLYLMDKRLQTFAEHGDIDGLMILYKQILTKAGNLWEDALDLPNMHTLREAIQRFLPLYENPTLFRTEPFECRHKLPKGLLVHTRHIPNQHQFISKKDASRASLTACLQGMRWGANSTCRLGDFWNTWSDPLNKERPHPALRRCSVYTRASWAKQTKENRRWVPSRYLPKKNWKLSDEDELDLQSTLKELEYEYEDGDVTDIRGVSQLIDRLVLTRVTLQLGDDVSLAYEVDISDDSPTLEFANIDRIIEVTVKGYPKVCIAWVSWWKRKGLLDSMQVETVVQWKKASPTVTRIAAVTCESFRDQVMLVHNCPTASKSCVMEGAIWKHDILRESTYLVYTRRDGFLLECNSKST